MLRPLGSDPKTEARGRSPLPRAALGAWLAVVALSSLPLFEPSRRTTCDPTPTGNCCIAILGDSQLHYLLLGQLPFCLIVGIALGWGARRPLAGRVTVAGFVVAAAVAGFASTLGENATCWAWSHERRAGDVAIALLGAAMTAIVVGIPSGLLAAWMLRVLGRRARASPG